MNSLNPSENFEKLNAALKKQTDSIKKALMEKCALQALLKNIIERNKWTPEMISIFTTETFATMEREFQKKNLPFDETEWETVFDGLFASS